jgi:ribose/xylose/arabinose/galactoside ABC-type transport system permease subunit
VPEKVFGSEPFLVTLGKHVCITGGARFITHEGGLWAT